MEKKFLRGLGTAGHIEDIAVDKSQHGKKLGFRIIQALIAISEGLGAYKTILDCSDDTIREPILLKTGAPLVENICTVFYEKCGMAKKGIQMVWLSDSVFAMVANAVVGKVCIAPPRLWMSAA